MNKQIMMFEAGSAQKAFRFNGFSSGHVWSCLSSTYIAL